MAPRNLLRNAIRHSPVGAAVAVAVQLEATASVLLGSAAVCAVVACKRSFLATDADEECPAEFGPALSE